MGEKTAEQTGAKMVVQKVSVTESKLGDLTAEMKVVMWAETSEMKLVTWTAE